MKDLLWIVEESEREKIKAGWSREVSSGFIKKDIEGVWPKGGDLVAIKYAGHYQTFKISELNRRETEELISYLTEHQ